MGINTGPWQEKAYTEAGSEPVDFNGSPTRFAGYAGNQPIGQVDVRTQQMKALETASLPLLIQTLTNPQAIAQQFGSIAGGVPQMQTSSLASYLFGGAGAPTGQQNGSQTGSGGGGQPPAGGGGGQSPASGGGSTFPALPPGIPINAGPLAGQISGQPIQHKPGVTNGTPIDELGNPIPASPDGNPANMPLYLRMQQMAQQLMGQGQASWQTPFNASGDLASLLTTLGAGYAGNDALANGMPTMGTATSALGELLNYSPALRGYNFTQPQTLGLASQIWQGLDPYSQGHTLNNIGYAASGGQFPTIQEFLNSIGIQTRAMGGPLDPNAPTLVGEMGPELITPAGAAGQQQVVPLAGPMAGAAQAPQNAFASSPVQGQGTGSIQRLLEQNPEQQAFQSAQNILFGQGGLLNSQGGGGQAVVDAMRPVFQQNLTFGMNELANRVPSVRNSGAAIEGTDLTSRALNDFNLMAAQALQQGQQSTLGGLGMLGQLAGQAGQGAFGRNLAAGQLATQRDLGVGSLALQQQQQAYNQAVNPTLQLLLAALGMATPTAYQTIVPGKD